MSRVKKLDRRTVLRGAGGIALSLPFLQAMGCSEREIAQAHGPAPLGRATRAATGFPRRIVIMFSPNGTIYDQWAPTGSETNFTLSHILSPLLPHKNDLIILDGVDCESAHHGPGSNAHDLSMGHLLTGTELVSGPQGVGDFGHLVDGSAGGISIDQELAKQIGAQTRFRSLELGVHAQNIFMPLPSRMSYLGPFKPVPAENDPRKALDRIFGAVAEDSVTRERLRQKRGIVLDAVLGDYRSLRAGLGTEDRTRLDSHLGALEEIERRVLAPDMTACTQPTVGTDTAMPAVGKAQMDILTAALACDVTRVVTLQWTTAQGGRSAPWLGISQSHHELSHAGDSDLAAKDKLVKINRWYAEQFAYLIAALKAVPEGTGTLLDSTLVVWINELSKGNTHSHNNVPIVMAGDCGGYFRKGRFLQYSGKVFHNNLLVSFLNAMGVPATSFGNPAYCTGPLSGLV